MNSIKMKIVGIIIATLLSGVSGVAHAVSVNPDIVDFNITSTNGGALVWDAATNRLVGTNISITDVTSQALPGLEVVTGPLTCTACVLNFASGTNVGGVDFSGDLNGSYITVSTTADLGGGVTGVLMTGKFTGGVVVTLGASNSILRLFGAGFEDTKDPAFVELLGFPSDSSWAGGLNLQFAASSGFTKGSAFSPLSGDITNIPVTVPSEVPLPGAAWLLGSGLLGLLKMSIRRNNAAGDMSDQ